MESINQSSNHSEKKDHVLLEMNCVELTENQNTDETCAPPNLQGNEDDNKKREKKTVGEPLNWVFSNNNMKTNYNLSNNSSVIEFVPEQEKNFPSRIDFATKFRMRVDGSSPMNKKWDKVCSLMQIPKPITSCNQPISFKMKIEDLGMNKVGHGDDGIEFGFTKMLNEEESRFARGRRMNMGLWYDTFNGGIYNYKTRPKEFVDKTKRNNVVEWRIEEVEEEDGVVKTKATLLLNNKNSGKSFLLDRTKDIHPSIYIGSKGAKVTIDVSGMGYTPTVIEYPDTTEGDCCSCVSSKCGLLASCLAPCAFFLAVYRLFTTCWMLGDITTDSLTTIEYYRFWQDSGSWYFFFAAVAIWILTPLYYFREIGRKLFTLLFNWEEFNKENDGRLENKLTVGFLRMFMLTPEKVNSYQDCLIIALVCTPLGILLLIALMCYSALIAYVQFPLFAIRVALEDVYKTLSEGWKEKVDQFFRRNKIMSKMLSIAKAFCGLGIFDEDDIVELKFGEALLESLFQFILSTAFFHTTKKHDLNGNRLVENVFIPDNAILLSSMIMSMVSIMIAINGSLIINPKLKHGTIFSVYFLLCIFFTVMIAGALLFSFMYLVVM